MYHASLPSQATEPTPRTWIYAAASAIGAAIPAGPGFALAAAGHPGAVPLLVSSTVIGVIPVIANAVVRMHDSSQRTRRLQIQNATANAITAAVVRCIDDSHATDREASPGQRAAEAASVRASATQMASEMMPAVLAVLGELRPAPDDLDRHAPAGRSGPGRTA